MSHLLSESLRYYTFSFTQKQLQTEQEDPERQEEEKERCSSTHPQKWQRGNQHKLLCVTNHGG